MRTDAMRWARSLYAPCFLREVRAQQTVATLIPLHFSVSPNLRYAVSMISKNAHWIAVRLPPSAPVQSKVSRRSQQARLWKHLPLLHRQGRTMIAASMQMMGSVITALNGARMVLTAVTAKVAHRRQRTQVKLQLRSPMAVVVTTIAASTRTTGFVITAPSGVSTAPTAPTATAAAPKPPHLLMFRQLWTEQVQWVLAPWRRAVTARKMTAVSMPMTGCVITGRSGAMMALTVLTATVALLCQAMRPLQLPAWVLQEHQAQRHLQRPARNQPHRHPRLHHL